MQDLTDLQKVLSYDAVDDARRHRGGATAVLGGLGGLVSHQLANLSNALEPSTSRHFGPLFFMGEQEICFVLPAGSTLIHCPFRNIHCSLVPLFGTVESVTTSGLRWNVTQKQMAFGRFISTSNEIVEDAVQVVCSEPLLWVFDARFVQHRD